MNTLEKVDEYKQQLTNIKNEFQKFVIDNVDELSEFKVGDVWINIKTKRTYKIIENRVQFDFSFGFNIYGLIEDMLNNDKNFTNTYGNSLIPLKDYDEKTEKYIKTLERNI